MRGDSSNDHTAIYGDREAQWGYHADKAWVCVVSSPLILGEYACVSENHDWSGGVCCVRQFDLLLVWHGKFGGQSGNWGHSDRWVANTAFAKN